MKISTQYKDTLKKKYRFNKSPWVASDGTLYIGYNHRVKEKEVFDSVLTRKEATLIFNKDILVIEKFLTRNLNRKVPQAHFDIMVSLCYDVGTKAVKNSSFFNLYKGGDITGAFGTYMYWCKSKGEFSQSLYKRRKEELSYINYT